MIHPLSSKASLSLETVCRPLELFSFVTEQHVAVVWLLEY